MLYRGNEVSRGLAALAGGSRQKPPLDLTLLYGRVLAIKNEPLWDTGQVQPCMLVALGELYSPTYECILFAQGFVTPIPGMTERLPVGTLLRFLAALENAFGIRPKLDRMARVTVIKGWERTKVLNLMDQAEVIYERPPKLNWCRAFRFARQIEKDTQRQMQAQAAERAKLESAKRRKLNSHIDQFLRINQSYVLRDGVLRPPTGSESA